MILTPLLFWRGIGLVAITICIALKIIPVPSKLGAVYFIIINALLVNWVAYYLARRLKYRLAVWLTVIENIASIVFIFHSEPTLPTVIGAPMWLNLSILIGSLVLTHVENLAIVGITICAYALIGSILPSELLPHLFGSLLFLLVLSVLAISGANIRQRSERMFREEQSKLVQASKLVSLGEMAGGIAHEINTPLSVISIRTENLIESLSAKINDKQREEFDQLLSTVDKIATIISGLRSFARDAKNDSYDTVDIRQVIDETLALCSERIAHRCIPIEVHAEDHPIYVNCRSVEISQVLMNLLNNSLDAIAELSEKWIKLQLTETPNEIEIRVTDSGLGIPKEVRVKMLEPFFTTKPIGKGTGLGLSISAGIVRAHGGELTYDDQSPNTCFTIRLPKTLSQSGAA